MNKLIPVMFVISLIGCGTAAKNGDAGSTDAGAVDSGIVSACGQPGDTGNSIGVGQYCTTTSDCSNNSALCSTVEASFFGSDAGIPATYFCTIPLCNPCADAQTTTSVCGPDAFCACYGPGECGCAPNSCANIQPANDGIDCNADAGTDAGVDAGADDAGADAGTDAGPV